ncbi:uncharacterized protein LOC123538025 [Mercenaria mercenaria]|uniref:uncharacterized protein LOC123538025 n=1 Tax=Mercenaria mercenaria TaxID=6596 RepID=UPI00234E6F3D|nr:uncharacterized protein LOC123538025 [Mercenaria mercenaria]
MDTIFYFVVVLLVCVTVVNAGEFCTEDTFGYTKYCATSCCGTKYNRYCCSSNVGLIVGIVLGVGGLVTVIVSVLVAVFCCCRKTRGQTGQVCQPTVPVYGVQTTTVSYEQAGYTNAAFPQQLQTPSMPGPVDDAQKWQQPPPSYNTVITS